MQPFSSGRDYPRTSAPADGDDFGLAEALERCWREDENGTMLERRWREDEDGTMVEVPKAVMKQGPLSTAFKNLAKVTPQDKCCHESDVKCPDYYMIPGIVWDHPIQGRKTLTVWDIVHALNLNHQQGNIVKYVIREGRKPGVPAMRDKKKTFWCALSELERVGTVAPNVETVLR